MGLCKRTAIFLILILIKLNMIIRKVPGFCGSMTNDLLEV